MDAAVQPRPPDLERLVGTVDLGSEAVDSTRGPALVGGWGRVTILDAVLPRVRSERTAGAYGRRRAGRRRERAGGRGRRVERSQPGYNEEQAQRQSPDPHGT